MYPSATLVQGCTVLVALYVRATAQVNIGILRGTVEVTQKVFEGDCAGEREGAACC